MNGGSRKQEVSLRSEQLLQVRLRARVSGHNVSSSGERAIWTECMIISFLLPIQYPF